MSKSRYAEYKFAKGWASVSQICGLLDKPYLYNWYAELGAEATRINADSKKIGSLIDNEICIYFGDAGIKELDRSVLDHPENKAYFNQALKNFYTVAEAIKAKSVIGQQVVYSMKYKYIGTFDRLLLIDDFLVLSDWKVTNSVGYPYLMQLEAYYRAYIEMHGHNNWNNNWHEFPLWICQFPKEKAVDLKKNIIKFKPNDLRFENFLHLLSFYYGKQKDEEENKIIKKFKKEKK